MMTREEAIRTLGDAYVYATLRGHGDGGIYESALMFSQAMEALGVTRKELAPIAARAAAEFEGDR
jgi:hypothetical protein